MTAENKKEKECIGKVQVSIAFLSEYKWFK